MDRWSNNSLVNVFILTNECKVMLRIVDIMLVCNCFNNKKSGLQPGFCKYLGIKKILKVGFPSVLPQGII